MITLHEFELEIIRVREAMNDMTIKGERNASLLVYAVGKCNDMIHAIHEVARQNKEAEEVTTGGHEQNSGAAE